MVLQREGQRLTTPTLTPPRTAKETLMTFLADFGLVAALATGFIITGLVGAVVLARIALAARDWLNRNDR